jgi:selenophosphate synthase
VAREIAKHYSIHGKIRLTQFSHGGGCGCRIAQVVSQDILSRNAPQFAASVREKEVELEAFAMLN